MVSSTTKINVSQERPRHMENCHKALSITNQSPAAREMPPVVEAGLGCVVREREGRRVVSSTDGLVFLWFPGSKEISPGPIHIINLNGCAIVCGT